MFKNKCAIYLLLLGSASVSADVCTIMHSVNVAPLQISKNLPASKLGLLSADDVALLRLSEAMPKPVPLIVISKLPELQTAFISIHEPAEDLHKQGIAKRIDLFVEFEDAVVTVSQSHESGSAWQTVSALKSAVSTPGFVKRSPDHFVCSNAGDQNGLQWQGFHHYSIPVTFLHSLFDGAAVVHPRFVQ